MLYLCSNIVYPCRFNRNCIWINWSRFWIARLILVKFTSEVLRENKSAGYQILIEIYTLEIISVIVLRSFSPSAKILFLVSNAFHVSTVGALWLARWTWKGRAYAFWKRARATDDQIYKCIQIITPSRFPFRNDTWLEFDFELNSFCSGAFSSHPQMQIL